MKIKVQNRTYDELSSDEKKVYKGLNDDEKATYLTLDRASAKIYALEKEGNPELSLADFMLHRETSERVFGNLKDMHATVDQIQGGDISESKWKGWVEQAVNEATHFIMDNWPTIREYVKNFWETIKETGTTIWEWFLDLF